MKILLLLLIFSSSALATTPILTPHQKCRISIIIKYPEFYPTTNVFGAPEELTLSEGLKNCERFKLKSKAKLNNTKYSIESK